MKRRDGNMKNFFDKSTNIGIATINLIMFSLMTFTFSKYEFMNQYLKYFIYLSLAITIILFFISIIKKLKYK
jgi:Na+/H+-dicarboxylate symporter